MKELSHSLAMLFCLQPMPWNETPLYQLLQRGKGYLQASCFLSCWAVIYFLFLSCYAQPKKKKSEFFLPYKWCKSAYNCFYGILSQHMCAHLLCFFLPDSWTFLGFKKEQSKRGSEQWARVSLSLCYLAYHSAFPLHSVSFFPADSERNSRDGNCCTSRKAAGMHWAVFPFSSFLLTLVTVGKGPVG